MQRSHDTCPVSSQEALGGPLSSQVVSQRRKSFLRMYAELRAGGKGGCGLAVVYVWVCEAGIHMDM